MPLSAKTRKQLSIRTERNQFISEYSELWKRMLRQWHPSRSDNAVWLLYSANYLFNTGGLKWAVDPVLPGNRLPEIPVLDAGNELADLDIVLLSHAHADHCDVALWSQLKNTHCHWIVPDHMMDYFSRYVSVNNSTRSAAIPGKEIIVSGVRIVPFQSPHYEHFANGETNQVDETGYLVETENASYLFPGDIRTYDPSCLKPYAPVSAVFAHVFLGRSAALLHNPPLLKHFVDFYLSCQPEKIVLSHLYEFGRTPEDCWLTWHARAVANKFQAADKGIEIEIPEWYQETIL